MGQSDRLSEGSMKKVGILLAVFVLALAFGYAPSRAQVSSGGEQATQCEPGVACPERPGVRRKVRKPKTQKEVERAVKPQEQKKSEARERTPYTEQERESAVVPGLPNVRFWADSLGAFAEAL